MNRRGPGPDAVLSGVTPGDTLVLIGPGGRWGDTLEYVGVDDEPGRIQVCRVADGVVYSVRADLVKRPHVMGRHGPVPARQGPEVASSGVKEGELASTAQKRLLFAVARRRGMGIDALRDATPTGSISRLTRGQAARLIDRLSGGSDLGAFLRGTVTSKQLGMFHHLCELVGFAPDELTAWLSRFGVRSFDEVIEKAHASRIIGGLLRMHQNRTAVRQGGKTRGHRSERSDAGTAG